MNTLKLSLENFQSISNAELEFSTGLNVIIGQSNSGKSATFRALKACLINPSGSQRFIKNGTKTSSVILEYNGNTIEWVRTAKESKYIINGEPYVNTGKSNAFKIIDDTGFVTDLGNVIMNVEEELQSPFPYGISDSDLFKLYENVFCVSDSAIILKSAKEHEEKAKGDIENCEIDLAKNLMKLDELEKFRAEVDMNLLRKYLQELSYERDRLNELNDGINVIKTAVALDRNDFTLNSFELTNRIAILRELNDTRILLSKLKQMHLLLKELKEVCIEVSSKLNIYNDLRSLQKEMSTIKELSLFEIDLQEFTNKLPKLKELRAYKLSLKSIFNTIKEKKIALEQKQKDMEYFENCLKQFKVCPLCHSQLN